jgi:hypothetical protein
VPSEWKITELVYLGVVRYYLTEMSHGDVLTIG